MSKTSFERTRNLDADLVQEAIELTAEQKKAVASLRRAFRKCQDAGVKFYCVLDSLGFLNGHNVEKVGDESDFGGENPMRCSSDLNQTLYFPSIYAPDLDSWADDTHYVALTEECLERLEA